MLFCHDDHYYLFLTDFRLGSKVAMFRYSSVEIYTTCKPQTTLQFDNPCRQDWFKEERRHVCLINFTLIMLRFFFSTCILVPNVYVASFKVLARGIRLFSEVAHMLQQLKDQLLDVTTTNCIGSLPVKDFSELEELLLKEKVFFENSLEKTIDQSGRPSVSVHELLNINWSYQDLLLELYVWDRRLHQLFKCISAGKTCVANCKDPTDTVGKITGVNQEIEKKVGELTYDRTTSVSGAVFSDCPSNKIYIDHQSVEIAAPLAGSQGARDSELSCTGGRKDEDSYIAHSQVEIDNTAQTQKVPSFEISEIQGNGVVAHPISMKWQLLDTPNHFRISEWDDEEKWIWSSFHESQLAYRKNIQIGCLEKFELVNHYSPSHMSPLFAQHEEFKSPQFTVGPGGNILCVLEDEISSIIARALAISEERHHLVDTILENGTEDARVEYAKIIENSYSFLSESSFNSSQWSSIGSSDSEASFSSLSSFSSDDLSGYDGLSSSSSIHPEITVNGKVTLRGKYSVTSIFANQFHDLRKKCCPSELAYITSLSRCKKWDAQGGKSKAFFAKTVDDRFIIKQIKKTEFESFIKFAHDYFKHVYHSLDTGSQTCLAKILGIYQVTLH
ncbi:hypothetical protein GUJ93_ZPchr0010g8592 [Zizania palustris]|uniref:PIPK domain-containing protein n=1 Tax=Zizania palustris TaxID=103762 RepID=A0A8J6BJV0_ZIZPA|nr:hypothetical protein GUJ93_ZPchr0010g8592 [Zizania palustris]